jgi:hypothetical protein
MPGSKTPRYSVEMLNDGEILVRGTLDPHEALKIAFSEEWDDLPVDLDDMLYQVARPRFESDASVTPEAIAEFGEALFAMLERAHARYWRKVPFPPSYYENGGFSLLRAEKEKPGAFPAVVFPR